MFCRGFGPWDCGCNLGNYHKPCRGKMGLGNDLEAYGAVQFPYELISYHMDAFRMDFEDFHNQMFWSSCLFRSSNFSQTRFLTGYQLGPGPGPDPEGRGNLASLQPHLQAPFILTRDLSKDFVGYKKQLHRTISSISK